MQGLNRTAVIGLAAGLLVTACHAPEGKSRRVAIEKSWPSAQVRSLQIEGFNGDITVSASNNPAVKLVARLGNRRRMDAHKLEEKYLYTSLSDGTLSIREKRRRKGSVMIFPFGFRDDSIDFDLTVPPGTTLLLSNVNGKVNVKGVEGHSTLKSVNGSITIDTPGAAVNAKTVNGRVKADFQQRFLGARLKTVNGSISVSLPPNSSFDCDISQVNGSFRSDVPLVVRTEDGGKNIDASVNGGKFPLELSTVNGSVVVKQRPPAEKG